MPKESKQSIGSAFIDKETGKTTIAINTDEIKTTSELIGTVFEEFSHILGGIADRQDKEVAKNTDEKGQESLGRPANEYFKDKYSKDDKIIGLISDGKDYSNVNLGEHLGDWSLDDEHQVSSSKKYEKDNGAFKVIAKPQNSETEGEAIANGHYKIEYTDSYKFSQEGKNSEIISELSKQAKELSKADPDNNYIVTVSREEGINIIAIPKSKSWGENLSNDIVKAKDAVVKYHKKSKEDWKNEKYLSSFGNAIVSRINLLNLIQTGIGTTISQQLYEFNPGEVQYGKVEDVLKRRTASETNAKGIIDTAVGSIASTTIPNKIGGGRITLPETAQAVVATGEAVGVGGKVVTLPVIGTGGAKVMLIVNAIGNGSKDSEKVKEPSNKNQEEIKLNSKEKRPSYKESEKDIHEFLKEKYKNNENVTVQEQTSFKGGDEAKRYGEKGSVRPDDTVIMKTETKNGVVTSRESYEVKNYKIENYNNMTSKIGEQAKIRIDELPKGTIQKVVIDARGQKLTAEIETKTIDEIIRKSDGIIKSEDIFFVK